MSTVRVVFLHVNLDLPADGGGTLREQFSDELRGIPHTLHQWVSRGSQFSAGYDERTGLAKKYPTLEQFLWKEVPNWRRGDPVALVGFSAGCWTLRHWLRDPGSRELTNYVLFLDGLHSEGPSMEGVAEYGRLAMEFPQSHRLFVSTTAVDPITYADTSETAEKLLDMLGVPDEARRARDDASIAGVRVLDYAESVGGNTAGDHVAQVRTLCPRILGTDCVDHFYYLLGGTEPGMQALALPDDTKTLGQRCVDWCFAEMARENPPGPETRRRYFSYTERDGKPTGIRDGNFCSAAQAAAMEECRLPGESRPYTPRASAKWEMIRDARKAGTWVLLNESLAKRSGAAWAKGDVEQPDRVPEVGDLFIHHRGAYGGVYGHIERVSAVTVTGDSWVAETIGANETGKQWRVETVTKGAESLIGLVPGG